MSNLPPILSRTQKVIQREVDKATAEQKDIIVKLMSRDITMLNALEAILDLDDLHANETQGNCECRMSNVMADIASEALKAVGYR